LQMAFDATAPEDEEDEVVETAESLDAAVEEAMRRSETLAELELDDYAAYLRDQPGGRCAFSVGVAVAVIV